MRQGQTETVLCCHLYKQLILTHGLSDDCLKGNKTGSQPELSAFSEQDVESVDESTKRYNFHYPSSLLCQCSQHYVFYPHLCICNCHHDNKVAVPLPRVALTNYWSRSNISEQLHWMDGFLHLYLPVYGTVGNFTAADWWVWSPWHRASPSSVFVLNWNLTQIWQ